MDKIPIAEEFFGYIEGENAYPPDFAHRKAIEFAKLHVKACREDISESEFIKPIDGESINSMKESILNAYPDKLII